MNRPENQEELNQRIREMQEAETESLKALQSEYDEKQPDGGIESLENYRDPLSMDVTKEINILLSWGGPSDGYKLRFDHENDLISGVYWYADWGTYAESPLNDEEMDLVESIYMGGDASIYLGGE